MRPALPAHLASPMSHADGLCLPPLAPVGAASPGPHTLSLGSSKTLAQMYQPQTDKPLRCSPQKTTPSGTSHSFHSLPQPSCHPRMSQKDYRASLDRMNKTAARALDTACRTHLLLLELGAKLGIIPPVTGGPTAIQPTCAASSSPGVLLDRKSVV